MLLLILSILALLLGPVLARFFGRSRAFNEFMDAFVLISIGGMAILHLLPEAFMEIGIMSLVMVALGALLPAFLERMFEERERAAHSTVLVLAFSGILLHTLLDGIALSSGSRSHGAGHMLAYAVVLHRLPVGLLIWWALRPLYSIKVTLAALLVMSASSIAGYILGGLHLDLEHSLLPTYFQSLVTGSLLHVLFHRHFHDEDEEVHATHVPSRKRLQLGSTAGVIIGGALLAYLPVGEHLPSEHSIGYTLDIVLTLFLESAPALLIGFTLAAAMPLIIPQAGFNWLRRGKRASNVTRGMLFGLPLPICSCGVVPLYHTLVRQGVPVGASMAFLIATPELGIDAVFISIPLLGWQMTVIRLIGAALVAWGSAYILDKFIPRGTTLMEIPLVEMDEPPPPSKYRQFWTTLNHDLIDELGPWIFLGLVIAAVADPFLAGVNWAGLPGWLDVPLLALVGMPIYVCATGATPIAAVMLLNGVSPGAVLAFLLTGPATNVSTVGVIRKLNGNRAAILFPLTVIGLTIIVGYSVNAITGDSFGAGTLTIEDHEAIWYQWIAGTILMLLFAGSLVRIGPRGMLGNIYEGLGDVSDDHDDHHEHHHG